MPVTRSIRARLSIADDTSEAYKDLGSNPAEAFLEFYVNIPAASLTALQSPGGTTLASFYVPPRLGFTDVEQGVNITYGPPWQWAFTRDSSFTFAGTVSGDTWYKVWLRCKSAGDESELKIDEVDPGIGIKTNHAISNLQHLEVGNYVDFIAADVYITGVKVGTTWGASDIFDGDVS